MSVRAWAGDQLRRILYILPAAAREGGVLLADLARELGVEQSRVLRDLEEITARSFYHPSGGSEDLQIMIEGDRVRVWTGGELRRPTKLSPTEALAAVLGLRAVLLEGDGENEPRRRLLQRIERDLCALAPAEVASRFGDSALERRMSFADLDADPDGIRETLVEAARERRPCRILYLKADAPAPEERILHPWVVAYGGGAWYAIGHCLEANGTRVFRLDRILEAELLEGRFDPPAHFDPAQYMQHGRVFLAQEPIDVLIRYSPRIARWLVERLEGVGGGDEPFVAGHRVSDLGWLVRHALQYGADAEVLEPAEVRSLIREAATRVARA